jgi:hypothetical protein
MVPLLSLVKKLNVRRKIKTTISKVDLLYFLSSRNTPGSTLSTFLVLDLWSFPFNIRKTAQLAQVKRGSPEIRFEIPSSVQA